MPESDAIVAMPSSSEVASTTSIDARRNSGFQGPDAANGRVRRFIQARIDNKDSPGHRARAHALQHFAPMFV